MTKVRTSLFVLLLMIIISVIFHTWVFSWQPVTSGDWHFNDEIILKEFFGLPNIINNGGFTGMDIMGLAFYPFNFLTSLLSHWGFTYSAALRLIFLYPIIFVGPISFFFLVRKYVTSNLAAFVGALLYLFNPYYMILSNGVLTLMASYSFFPLALLLFSEAIEKSSLKRLLLTGLILYISSFYEPRGLYLMAPILIGFALYYLIVIKSIRSPFQLIKNMFYYGIPFYLVLGLNLYWIFGLLANRNIAVNQALFNRALFGEGYMSTTAALAQFHPFWAGDHSTNFQVMKIPLRFWLLPFGSIMGIWVGRKNKVVLFFGLIAFFGILLSKQSTEPFGGLYKWLFMNVPGFSAFRESSKFYFYLALGYGFLNAAFVSYLIKAKHTPRIVTITFISLMFYVAARTAQGQYSGQIEGLSVIRHTPSDYLALKNYIVNQEEYFRTLWLPYYSRWIPNYQQHPKLAANALYYSPWNLINPDQPVTVKSTEAERFVEMLSQPESRRLLDMSGIKYVIIPLKDEANNDEFFYLFNQPRSYYVTAIKNIGYLNPVEAGLKDVKIYETPSHKPLFYLTHEPEDINQDIPATPVTYNRISSYEYLVTLPEINSDSYLNFINTYDPNWRIVDPSVSWPGVLKTDSIISKQSNRKSIAGFNSISISPQISRKTIKLYYYPQAYVFLGSYLSLGIFILALALIAKSK